MIEVGSVVKLKNEHGRGVVIKRLNKQGAYESYPNLYVTFIDYLGEKGRYAKVAVYEDELEVVWGT